MRLSALSATCALTFLLTTPALAQATRTWVSGVGDDVNPCSRTAPCKTFAGAISKTAVNGEISVLDPGGFGAVTITKNISIVAEGNEGGILGALTNGVNVTTAGIIVHLKGLTIQGSGTGITGINIAQPAFVTIQDSVVRGFGVGVSVKPPSGNAELTLKNVTVVDNSDAGVLVQPTGTGSARAAISDSKLSNNLAGVRADASVTSGDVVVGVIDSTASNNTNGGLASTSNGASSRLNAQNVLLHGNGIGLNVNGANAVLMVGSSNINGNGVIFQSTNGGSVLSYGNNQMDGNGNAVFPPTLALH